MKVEICDRVIAQEKFEELKKEILKYLKKHHLHLIFSPKLSFNRSGKTITLIDYTIWREYDDGYIFNINYIEKIITVYYKRYWDALYEYGEDNNFKMIIRYFAE